MESYLRGKTDITDRLNMGMRERRDFFFFCLGLGGATTESTFRDTLEKDNRCE